MPTPTQTSPTQALITLRILWAAMITGLLLFAVVISQIPKQSPNLAPVTPLLWICASTLFCTTLAGYDLRMRIYKRNWRGQVITPRGYLAGNLLLFACLEGPAFLSLITCMRAGTFWPYAIPAAIALLLLLINFPTGRPLQPSANPYRP